MIFKQIPGLTILFIVTSPRPHFLHAPGVPHIHFPAYPKPEALKIISLYAPSSHSRHTPLSESGAEPKREEMKDIWTRFCSAVWDTLSKHSGRDIISFRATCTRLYPSFIAPLEDGLFTTKDFSRLLVSRRSLFQDEHVLVPSIIPSSSRAPPPIPGPKSKANHLAAGIATQLPIFSRLLLIAAYLASYTPARNDALLFMKASLKARRKKGGGTAKSRPRASKHRKISTKLLGPQSFVLERMLAIFHAVRIDAGVAGAQAGTADIPMAIATLASLRLVIRTSAVADALDASTKWKVNVGWEVVRGVARSVGVEVEDFVIE
jgi:origin recognition complex subunit 5